MSVLTDKEQKEFLRKKQIARTKASLMAKKRGHRVRSSIVDRWKADNEIFNAIDKRKRNKR
ncbi:hypothetical protein [Staphylococcus chromogenes]|uniref:hypothetical protein n=1 Tax=Staphylococcus chromogenes TaxID=46126 RepID=UPI000E67C643|nr:hypothetical protein [Staphylococcus chromogenes]RIM16827.1 hypothetical protein BU672_01850 [Staphylococcus chromogenes]